MKLYANPKVLSDACAVPCCSEVVTGMQDGIICVEIFLHVAP